MPCGSCPGPRPRQLGTHAPFDAVLVHAQTVHPSPLQSQDPCIPRAAHPPQRDSGLAACRFKGHGGCPGQLPHLHVRPVQPGTWAGLPLGHCNLLLQDRLPAEPGVPAWSPWSAEGRLLRGQTGRHPGCSRDQLCPCLFLRRVPPPAPLQGKTGSSPLATFPGLGLAPAYIVAWLSCSDRSPAAFLGS